MDNGLFTSPSRPPTPPPQFSPIFQTLLNCSISFFTFLFIYLWLCWVFVAVHEPSLAAVSGATLLVRAQASPRSGFSCWGARALGAQAQQLRRMGLVALGHVGSSQTRDWTHVPCISRQILFHGATRKAPGKISFPLKLPDFLRLQLSSSCHEKR